MAKQSTPPTLPMNVRPLIQQEGESNPESRLYLNLVKQLGVWKDYRKNTVEAIWTKALSNFKGDFDDNQDKSTYNKGTGWRSRAFYPLTEQKLMGAQSQLQDILFKGMAFPYNIKSSPLPDDPDRHGLVSDEANNLSDTEQQAKSAEVKAFEARMKNMKKTIDDQLVESDAAAVGLMGIFDGGLYGTAFFESPKTIRRKRYYWDKSGTRYKKKEKFEDVPTVARLNPWDCWPDPECNGDVQKGLGFYHCENMSIVDLQNLYNLVFNGSTEGSETGKEDHDYIYNKEEFDQLLHDLSNSNYEGPRESAEGDNPTENQETQKSRLYEVYTFSGAVKNSLLKQYIPDLEGHDAFHSEAIIVFCNKRILKAVLNPFPGGRRPYHMVPWTRIPGTPFGRGVAEKIFDAQINVNRLIRMYIDNKRLSGNMMTAIDKSKLSKGSTLDVYPGKNWEFDGGYAEADVGRVMQPIFFPDVTDGVLAAINTMVEWADVSSGVPRILEGNAGESNATAFSDNQRLLAASKQLGLVLKNFDIFGWVPIVESFYDWNMEFNTDENLKGDFDIVATGFSTFESRNMKKIELERIMMMAPQVPELAERVKPEPLVEDWSEASGVDPERYLLSETEVLAKRQAQQEEQNAQIKGQLEMQEAAANVEHQRKKELIAVENQASGMVRAELEQIKAQTKVLTDQMKQQHEKLLKLADIESKDKEKGGNRGNGRSKPRGNSNR